MAEIVPNTVVKVLRGIPLDDTYSDTILFENESAQTAYFTGKAKATYTGLMVQRVDSTVGGPRKPATVRLEVLADELYDCNYIMFQNSNFGQKWFYAFIKRINYLNPQTTEIEYEIDHFQTWFLSAQIKPSFVEREHTLNDAIFANLEAEPVEPGIKVCTGVWNNFSSFTGTYVYVGLAGPPDGKSIYAGDLVNGRSYSGVQIRQFSASDASGLSSLLTEYAVEGTLDRILFIVNAPFQYGQDFTLVDFPDSVQMAGSVGGYTPRNKKLLAYPFQYLEMISPTGNVQTLYYEKFSAKPGPIVTPSVSFSSIYTCTPTPCVICMPSQYDIDGEYGNKSGVTGNSTYAFTFDDFPYGAWLGNVYANWLAQNQAKTGVALGKGLLKAGAGVIAGNPMMGISAVGGLADIAADLTDRENVSMAPMGTATNGAANYVVGRVGIEARRYQIRPDRARRIDTFFDMFGYATNEVKQPNLTGRQSYNYVKTRGAVIEGSMPVESMATIKAMFNNGIRLWHNAQVKNFELPNPIVKEG